MYCDLDKPEINRYKLRCSWVKKEHTSPIPIPYTNLPTTNIAKLGANAVTRAPTRYSNAAAISSLLLPKNQICHQIHQRREYIK